MPTLEELLAAAQQSPGQLSAYVPSPGAAGPLAAPMPPVDLSAWAQPTPAQPPPAAHTSPPPVLRVAPALAAGIGAQQPSAPGNVVMPFAAGAASGVGAQSAPTVLPAHEVSAVAPARAQAIDDANQAQQQAVTGQMGAASAQSDAEGAASQVAATGLSNEAQALADVGGKTDERAAKREAEAAKRVALADTKYGELATRTIDPNHYLAARSTGQKILDAIGGFLGGAASMGRGPNQYLEHMQSLVQNDISAQRANFDNAKSLLGDKDSLYRWAYQQVGGDADEAHKLAGSIALKHVAKLTEAAVAGVQDPIIRAKAARMIAELEQKREELAGQGAQEQAKLHPYVQAQSMGAGAGGPVDWKVQHQLSEDLEKASVPQSRARIAELEALISRAGDVPGSSLAGRALRGVAGEYSSLRGTDARQFDAALGGLAESVAKDATGRASPEAIAYNKELLRGNGSAEDIRAGLARMREVIDAKEKNIRSGAPATQSDYQRGGAALTPTAPKYAIDPASGRVVAIPSAAPDSASPAGFRPL